jgi:hypothetical protein
MAGVAFVFTSAGFSSDKGILLEGNELVHLTVLRFPAHIPRRKDNTSGHSLRVTAVSFLGHLEQV